METSYGVFSMSGSLPSINKSRIKKSTTMNLSIKEPDPRNQSSFVLKDKFLVKRLKDLKTSINPNSILVSIKTRASNRKALKEPSGLSKTFRRMHTDLEQILKKPKMNTEELTAFEMIEVQEYTEVYYLGIKANKVSAMGGLQTCFEDDSKYYRLNKSDHIAYRYEVIKILGKGSFGQVCEAYDHKEQSQVAIKVLRSDPSITKQGACEIELLNALKGSNCPYAVKMLSSFKFRGHVCIVFELLSKNLYSILKANKFKGLPLKVIFRIGQQLLDGLKSLHCMQIIHCDLKPENILLRSPKKTGIRIIDFGSGCFNEQKVFTYIQSRFYRAPEILLGIPYDMSIDMWSFGCVIYELFVGIPLFPAENEFDLMLMIVEVIGMPPPSLIKKGARSYMFFEGNKFNERLATRQRNPCSRDLEELSDSLLLADLIEKCLIWDPADRITPGEAINHEFFRKGL